MDIDGGSSSRDGEDGDNIPHGVEIQCLFCEKSWKSSNNITRLRDHVLHANMRDKTWARSWRGDSGKKVASANIVGCEKCPDGVYKNILMMTRAKEDRSKNMKVGDGLAYQILAGMRARSRWGAPFLVIFLSCRTCSGARKNDEARKSGRMLDTYFNRTRLPLEERTNEEEGIQMLRGPRKFSETVSDRQRRKQV
ncbi:hypothetical protein R1sor_017457 [Riccia sorocarpa]|uniref:C2H2-type domain-containing protein n=1 Tax=Riccia sorocarpa TaxID=122646 RepID=A0ABD3I6X3_9MARC